MSEPKPELYGLPPVIDTGFNGMPYVVLGRSGLRVSKVGLGTWKIGFPETGDGSRIGEETAFRIFDRAIELGVTFWDTANRYNGSSGNSERVIGRWLQRNRDQRRNIVLATKLFETMDGRTPNHCRLSRLNVKESFYASLERLQIDRVDLLYFHEFDALTPIDESLEAVSDLISQDLVRYLGVSNFKKEHLLLYSEFDNMHLPRIIAVQNGFNILEGSRPGEEGVLEYCTDNGIGFVPYSPLARGLLTERYLQPDKVGKGDRLVDENLLGDLMTDEILGRLRKLCDLAQQWDHGMAELALAYTLSLPGLASVIPSCTSIKQLEANARAGTIDLSEEQRQEIKSALGKK
jgi:aryl-alcohol dehydrogenase-like predicted oxidoreductase